MKHKLPWLLCLTIILLLAACGPQDEGMRGLPIGVGPSPIPGFGYTNEDFEDKPKVESQDMTHVENYVMVEEDYFAVQKSSTVQEKLDYIVYVTYEIVQSSIDPTKELIKYGNEMKCPSCGRHLPLLEKGESQVCSCGLHMHRKNHFDLICTRTE